MRWSRSVRDGERRANRASRRVGGRCLAGAVQSERLCADAYVSGAAATASSCHQRATQRHRHPSTYSIGFFSSSLRLSISRITLAVSAPCPSTWSSLLPSLFKLLFLSTPLPPSPASMPVLVLGGGGSGGLGTILDAFTELERNSCAWIASSDSGVREGVELMLTGLAFRGGVRGGSAIAARGRASAVE